MQSEVREAIGPAEAMLVLDNAVRPMTTFAALPREPEPGQSRIVRLQRGPSALRF